MKLLRHAPGPMLLTLLVVLLPALSGIAGPPADAPANWAAPPYWLPASPVPDATTDPAPVPGAREGVASPAAPDALPSGALPFFAISPCRYVDTRGLGAPIAGGDFAPGETRTYDLNASLAPCPQLPANVQAYSVNATVILPTVPGFLSLYPTGPQPSPLTSTVNYTAGSIVANAAVVPCDDQGRINALAQESLGLLIDINGYYAPLSAVTSLTTGATTLTGAVTLTPGANVTITPSGQTLTIASSGGGSLPSGAASQTLRHDGAGWVASGQLLNTGTGVTVGGDLGVGGNLALPASSATAGQILVNGTRFLHGAGTGNTFLGPGAGNFTTSGVWNAGVGTSALTALTTGGSAAALGYEALASMTTGGSNVGVGSQALRNATAANWNVGVGTSALRYAVTAGGNVAVGALSLMGLAFSNGGTAWDSENTAVGFKSLLSTAPTATSNGIQNTAVGAHTLWSNTTGAFNVAFGHGALYSSTTADANVAVGRGTLYFNTTAGRNVAVGDYALRTQSFSNGGVAWSSENTAVGSYALYGNQPTASTNGVRNTAIGAAALQANTTGADNAALGHAALYANTTASGNTAVGRQALATQSYSNAGALWSSENTAVGFQALFSNQPTTSANGFQNTAVGAFTLATNSTGSFNVAVGHGALYTATTAESNVALGRGALHDASNGHHNVAVGDMASEMNSIGSWNVAVGAEALLANQTGAGNVAIGYRAGYTETTSNKLYIGNSLGTLIYGQFDTGRVGIAATDPSVALDVNGLIRSRTIASSPASTTVCVSATGVLGTCSSDARLKTDVVDLSAELDVLAALSRLRGVSFRWDASQERARDLGKGREIGFLAQEVEPVLPNVVSTAPDGYKSLDYAKLTAFLVEVARAQQAEIEELRHLVTDLVEERRMAR